jgi:hypothetical protein
MNEWKKERPTMNECKKERPTMNEWKKERPTMNEWKKERPTMRGAGRGLLSAFLLALHPQGKGYRV